MRMKGQGFQAGCDVAPFASKLSTQALSDTITVLGAHTGSSTHENENNPWNQQHMGFSCASWHFPKGALAVDLHCL